MKCIILSKEPDNSDPLVRFLHTKLQISSTVISDLSNGASLYEPNEKNQDLLFTLVDIQYSKENAIEILKDLEILSNGRPLIYFGDPGTIRSLLPNDFYERNAMNSSFTIPISDESEEEFFEALGPIVKSYKESQKVVPEEKNASKDNFVPIKIKNFYRFQMLPYDAYLELSEGHFVKIINSDEFFSSGIIQKYIQKGVKFIHVEKNEHLDYLTKITDNLLNYFVNKNISPNQILILQKRSMSIIHEHIRTLGVSDDIIALTTEVLKKVFSHYKSFGSLPRFLGKYILEFGDPAERSLLTAYVCCHLLDKLEFSSDLAKKKLGLASILHDIFIKYDELSTIISKDEEEFIDLPEAQKEHFLEHPIKSSEVAQMFSGFPETEFIIQQHHELPNGKGFPSGLHCSELSSLSAIFILATNFVNQLTIQKTISDESLQFALVMINNHYEHGKFKEPAQALLSLF